MSLNFYTFGTSFHYKDILQATYHFKDKQLMVRGHSGDLFTGFIRGFREAVVIKRIDCKVDAHRELYLFSTVSDHSKLAPLLGYCLASDENTQFLVYKYLQKRDLTHSLFIKRGHPNNRKHSLKSLDWITRSKIAIQAARCLVHLHHKCDIPLVHGDVQASSILLDENFEVRLGSLSHACPQGRDSLHEETEYETISMEGTTNQTPSSYDIYCFGKVLLELVTGRLGLSSSRHANSTHTEKFLRDVLVPHIYAHDKIFLKKIVDPTLLIGDDLLKEVRSMAIIAKSCLHLQPNHRPGILYVLEALENPLEVLIGREVSQN